MEYTQESIQSRTLYRVKIENPILGVPITFLDKHNPAQFEIVGRADGNIANEVHPCYIPGFKDKGGAPLVKGGFVYKRVLIRRRLQTR